ncbi:hypothetical protein NSZ01_39960 [Nocardioides szechwanensis]|uniref:DUF732 domain-containing protein n=1 Tax=Nocardioides szechwanensis TaxID=1005944 RepID=A0A1H0E4A2_9ACTN|nr:hypothetical protein [Nocardioides szechwanensis]GEP36228.1 hypothetical protein NSZ01_39960 [Nocardioides szechwanensis]SDN77287.1 hypothetical protein SAMN05192576_2756 [Nocardioides szechwanensis]
MIRPVRLLTLLLPAVLLLGCTGGDDEPAPAAPTIDTAAVQQALVGLWVGDDVTAEATQAGECFAAALTDSATPDELRDAGLLDESYAVPPVLPPLGREGAELWVDAQFKCVDFVSESARAQVAATKGKVDATAYETCLRKALTEDQLYEAAVQSVMGDFGGDAVAAFSQAQLDCVQQALPPD